MGDPFRGRLTSRRAVVVLALAAAALVAVLARAQTTPDLTFVDVAADRGVDVPTRVTRGGVWEDFDGDGFLDLALGNIFSANQLFLNDGTGHFSDVSESVGISQSLEEESYGTNVADYDNDGDPDVVFANGGFNSLQVVRLYRNDSAATGGFTEVGRPAGVAGTQVSNHTALWLDYDNDGFLDLFVHKRGSPDVLYHNLGNGTFADVAHQAGVDVLFGANGACAGDFDNDGNVDLFLPDYRIPGAQDHGILFHNDGNGTFSDVTTAAGLFAPIRAFTCAIDDFNQDGWLDLYVAAFNTKADPFQEPSRLYINTGMKSFVEVAAAANADIASDIMGLQTGDLNNDGYPEIFAGLGEPASPTPDILLLNRTDPVTGTVSFEDVSDSSGIHDVPATRTHGMSFADFDRDGKLDVFVGNGGNMPTTCACPDPLHPQICPCPVIGQEEPNRLWLNTSPLSNNWFRFRLRGVASNRDAIGARVEIDAGSRRFFKHVSGGNGFNTRNAFEMIAGIGRETSVDRVLIQWPSGISQVVASPALGATYVWPETGLLAPTTSAAPGETVTLNAVGPAGFVYEVYLSESRLTSNNTAGELLLAPPQYLLGGGTLPANGVGQVPAPFPAGARPGKNYFFQARIKISGTWYPTNVQVIKVQ